jgi:hypothetical protein
MLATGYVALGIDALVVAGVLAVFDLLQVEEAVETNISAAIIR